MAITASPSRPICWVPFLAFALFVALTSRRSHGEEPPAKSGPDAPPPSSIGPDFADPFVLREGNVYYAFGTGTRGQHVQAAMSTDRAHWRTLPDALPNLPRWASREAGLTWAPSILKRPSQYVLYYTARDEASGFQCISRATARSARGPYLDSSAKPMICQVAAPEAFCGSIDPSPFVDRDGTAYLYWKSDENSSACRTPPRLWVQRLTEDGLDLEGGPTALLGMDQAWEAPIVEGPSMVLEGDEYYLFYSANWYASDRYSIGYATCRSATGPCRKVTLEAPWAKSHGRTLGPGGQEFFDDPLGQRYVAFHAWTAPSTTYEAGGARSLHIEPVTFLDGIPTLARRDDEVRSARLGAAAPEGRTSP